MNENDSNSGDKGRFGEPGGSGGPKETADPIIGEAVGSRLKTLFAEFTGEEVPDRFLDLIGRLEEKEQADKDGNSPTSGSDTNPD